MINVNNLDDFFTNEECEKKRNDLILKGIIKPAGKNDVITYNNNSYISTYQSNKILRKKLAKNGVIDPIEVDGKPSYCELYKRSREKFSPNESGEYTPTPIRNDIDYYRKRQIYFRILQEILYSRKSLNLNLCQKRENDPDWYF